MVFSVAAKNALDFIFPRLCIVCVRKLTEGAWLCDGCRDTLIKNNARRDACPRCGQNRKIKHCTCEYNWDFPFESIFSVFDFDETIKYIVHEFKYDGKKRLAFDMGKTFMRLIPESFFEGMDMVVPVPLFFLRLLSRGYNQAGYYARGITSAGGKKIVFLDHALIRKRPTKNQARLSRKRRRTNLQGAFMVPSRKIPIVRDKNIIIADDVVTTGATTRECALALRAAGCGKLKVLSLARD
jgi:competence protein ComFC